ncbi:MAG: PAS domain-containing protein, partial [Spirochaetaceae bacterium]
MTVRETDLNTIYDHLPFALCVTDGQRRILYANRALGELVGISTEQLVGGTAVGAFGCIHALEDPRGCGFGERCSECAVRLAA